MIELFGTHSFLGIKFSVYIPPSKNKKVSCFGKMECEKLSEEAKVDDNMVTCELEAAEALAAMARCSAVSVVTSSDAPEDRATASQQFCGNASILISNPLQNVETTHRMCSTSYPLNSARKSRQNLTKADKEAQRRRRVLANRESARRTIRRRQALYSELACKEAELSAENQHLKREKELAIKKRNSLKTRNGCLKVQMSKVTRAATKEIQKELKSAQAEKCTSASRTPFLCNQPFGVPVFWPPIGPPSDVFRVQCASLADAAMSSQLPLQLMDILRSHPEQDNSTSLNEPGAPIFVYPIPWPFPFLTRSSMLNSESALSDKQNEKSPSCQCCTRSSSDTLVNTENKKLLTQKKKLEASISMQTLYADNIHGARFSVPPDGGDQQLGPQPVLFSPSPGYTRQTASFRCTSARVEDSSEVESLASAPEHMVHTLSDSTKPIIWYSGKSKDNIASTEARRKRKELCKLKNLHCQWYKQ